MASCGVISCLTCGTGWIAGIASVCIGSTIGRCFGQKLGNKKKGIVPTNEDDYILRLSCMLQLGKEHIKKSHTNMNT